MRLTMIRPGLEGIPFFDLPKGFSLRWYQPGDDRCWFEIHRRADRENVITPDLFRRKFGSDEGELGRRQAYLVAPDESVIGTASAWFDRDFEGGQYGRVHYVAILPEYQGRGLSKPLLAKVCTRLRELGHERAYLTTSTGRLRAIRLYLRFGFVPLIRSPEDAKALQEINSPAAAPAVTIGQCLRGHS